MKFVDHVPDHLVTELVYRHLPSWHALACYFDWRKHFMLKVMSEQATAAANSAAGRRLMKRGAVLTEAGWHIPSGPLNPRVIDQPGTAVSIPDDPRSDAEVDDQQVEHELTVLGEDLFVFARQWEAVTNQTQKTRRRLLAARGRSEEREAYMVRWHGENSPKH